MLFLAKLVNISYKLGLPLPAATLFFFERRIWKEPGKIKEFLSAVHPEALWRIAEAKLLYLVNRYVAGTPALAKIKEAHFPSGPLSSLKEFKELFPILDKDNYVRRHSLEELCQGGKLPHSGGFYKSAGTSGRPTLWVESLEEELYFDKAVAFIGHTLIDTSRNDYVIINCWAMGSWPTGINFAAAARLEGKMVNVGVNVQEAAEVLLALGPRFKYLIAGYPPSVYHLVHEIKNRGANLKEYTIDIVSGGEGFVEEWRDVLLQELNNPTIFSVYGSTDKGLGEGLETSLAYLVRSLLYAASMFFIDELAVRRVMELRFRTGKAPFDRETAKRFLLDFLRSEENIARLPMVFQFDPTQYYNENLLRMDPAQSREVPEFVTTILSPTITLPRVRYNIHDEGFVMKYGEVMTILEKYKIKIEDFNVRSDQYLDLHLPFLFIFGRSDGTVSLDGANIFPEDIEQCLRQFDRMFSLLNSFQLFTTKDYRLGVAVELLEGQEPSREFSSEIEAHLKDSLAEYSFGYRELVHDRLPSANLVVELHRFGQGPFKDRNVKLRYVRH